MLQAGFEVHRPAAVVCTGVTLYLTKEAIVATLDKIAKLATGSMLAMSFYLPMAWLDEEDRPVQEMAEKGAHAAGTPFVSFFTAEKV